MAAALSLASAPGQQIFYFLVALLSPVDGLGKCGWRMNRRGDFLRSIFNARQARACDNETFGMTASLGIASAICFDSKQADHPHAAAQAGAQVYAAGVLVSPQGYPGDSALWQQAAQQHGLYVLVANHGAPSGPWSSAGRSACWGPDGRLLGEITGLGAALLVVHIDRTAKPGEVAVSKY